MYQIARLWIIKLIIDIGLVVWGFVYASVCNLATVLSHGEIFAVYPSAAGQYHWAAILSPPRWKNLVSWITGLLNVIGLWLGAATAGYLSSELRAFRADVSAYKADQMISATLLMAAISVNKPDVALTASQQYGIFAAIILLGPAINLCLGTK